MSASKIKTIYIDPAACSGEQEQYGEYLESRFPGVEIIMEPVSAYPVRFEDGSEEEMGSEEYERFCNQLWDDYCNS